MSRNAVTVSPKSPDGTASPEPEEVSKPHSGSLPLKEIETAIRSIRHGVVQIIIQDGVVIQIDRTEKVRLR